MATDTAKAIEKRNWDYIDNLGNDITKYVSFLSVMSRFHRYSVEDLPSFALEAPASFTAVARPEFWAKNYSRTIQSNAKGVTLVQNGQEISCYDVSETDETEDSRRPTLWQYKEEEHSKYINAAVPGSENTEVKIRILAANIVSKSFVRNEDRELVALSATSVALERMGVPCEETHRQLAAKSMHNHDVRSVLMNTYSTARGILDAVEKSVFFEANRNVNEAANNPLIQSFGVIDRGIDEQDEIQEEIESQQGMFLGFEDEYSSEDEMVQTQVSSEPAETNNLIEAEAAIAEDRSSVNQSAEMAQDAPMKTEEPIQTPEESELAQAKEELTEAEVTPENDIASEDTIFDAPVKTEEPVQISEESELAQTKEEPTVTEAVSENDITSDDTVFDVSANTDEPVQISEESEPVQTVEKVTEAKDAPENNITSDDTEFEEMLQKPVVHYITRDGKFTNSSNRDAFSYYGWLDDNNGVHIRITAPDTETIEIISNDPYDCFRQAKEFFGKLVPDTNGIGSVSIMASAIMGECRGLLLQRNNEQESEKQSTSESANSTSETFSEVMFNTEDLPESNQYIAWIPDDSNQPRPVRFAEYQRISGVIQHIIRDTIPKTTAFYYDPGIWSDDNKNSDLYFDGFRFVFPTKEARDFFQAEAERILSENIQEDVLMNDDSNGKRRLFNESLHGIASTVNKFINGEISAADAKDEISSTYALYQNNIIHENAEHTRILYRERRIAGLEIDLFESYHQGQLEKIIVESVGTTPQEHVSTSDAQEITDTQDNSEKKNESYIENLSEDEQNPQIKSQNNTEKIEYKYYITQRGISPGVVPNGFTRYNEDDDGARYGAVYYDRELTGKEISDYELTPAFEQNSDRNKESAENETPIEQDADTSIGIDKTETESEQTPSYEDHIEEKSSNVVIGEESASKRSFNQILEDDAALIRGNSAEKIIFRRNLIAIRTLQRIEEEKRSATSEEMEKLKGYSGFGGIPKAFDLNDPEWSREAVLLKSIMSEKEYASLRQTVLNAYYTPNGIVQEIYKGLENMGFSSGTILDPSMGIGAFFANMPETMKSESHLYGVELDSLTGRMSRALYPDAEVNIQGFETTSYLDNSFDAAVSNVPFGDYRIYDPRQVDKNYLVHNYFIDKMIDQVRPGGVVAVITSKGTMDSKDNSVRNSIAQKADLIRALRLPNTAFSDAGASVTTDILFFQKREKERDIDDIPEWLDARSLDEELNPTEDGVMSVNNYFIHHPEDVLGRLVRASSAHGPELACVSNGKDLVEAVAEAVATLPKVYSREGEITELPKQIEDTNDYDAMSFIIENGELKFYDGIKITESKLKGVARNRVLHAMRIRDAAKEVINIQVRNGSDEELAAAQAILSSEYDSYIESFGSYLSEDQQLKRNFAEDASYPLLRSLENYKKVEDKLVYDGKTAIFSERTINPDIQPIHADTAIDALAISMQQKARVDLSFMEDLTGMTRKELVEELEFSRIFYDFDEHEYKIADEYLSGDVRAKIEKAEGIAKSFDREFMARLAKEDLQIPDIADYTPKNDVEAEILDANPDRRPYGSLDTRSNYDYIAENQDDRNLIVQVTARHGHYAYGHLTNLIQSKINEDPTIVLDAMLIGRTPEDSRLDIDKHIMELIDAIGETETIENLNLKEPTERLYMLYAFLKENVNDILEFEYPSKWNSDTNAGFLKSKGYLAKWEDFKDEYYERKNVALKKLSPEMEYFAQIISQARKNIEALEKVKPKDLLPEEIHVSLGATWIPEYDIEDFLKETFKLPSYVSSDLAVRYAEATGYWKIEYDRKEHLGERATLTYGVEDHINGLALAELALNLKQPKIHKTVYIDGEEKEVIDQEKTILAQEKQTLLQREFEKWIFKDEDRAERLARYYNRHFNNIVPRQYDGSLLSFPGMNSEITLKEHQRNAIAHTLFGGNTLLAHCVGAGKTFEMVASIMEAKRLGLTKKPLVVVPKHLTEQFGTEFLRLYPNANILIASEKEFSTKNRQEFCSKIATQNWDAVVLGYTQLERIPISKELDQKMMEEQIEEIIDIIKELKEANGAQFSIRQAENKRKTLQAKLQKISDKAIAKQDNTITFEQLGCDRMYVDEAHYFKNLETFTKMQNIPGISTSKSDKTNDFYKKCQYINSINKDKCGLVFATGTPVSNSMSELYTMEKYLQPDRLKSQKVYSFDAWATNFGQTVTGVELSPDGSGFRTKTRFAKFHNMPELMNMFTEVADIKTADQLDLDVPEVEYLVGKVAATSVQKQMVQDLVERAQAVRDKKVDKEVDNMLKITTDGKKLALDQRLIDPSLPDDPNSKVNLCVKNILDIYNETAANKSTQLVFCDQSTPSDRFNVYDDVKEKLIAGGVDPSEVAFIHDAKTSEQKDALFERVRKGEVRILLGSTSMMGTGTNVQDKLIATHDLDVPWRPSDLEQRAGRIVRQGNENKNVKIFRYVTEGTFDGYLWQIIENKQRFISQIMTSKTIERSVEDVDETTLSYAEIKAIAAGNPLVKEKMDIDVKLNRIRMARDEHGREQHKLAQKVEKFYPEEIQRLESKLALFKKDVDTIRANTESKEGQEVFSIKFGDKIMDSEKEAKNYIAEMKKEDISLCRLKGEYKGMKIKVTLDPITKREKIVMMGYASLSVFASMMPGDNVNRIKELPAMFEAQIHDIEKELADTKESFRIAKEDLGSPFPQEEEYTKLSIRSAELGQILNQDESTKNIENEGEKRIEAILNETPDNQCERSFFSLAKRFLKSNDNQWQADFDDKASRELLGENFSKDAVTETLFRHSPSLFDKNKIASIVNKTAQTSYVASR